MWLIPRKRPTSRIRFGWTAPVRVGCAFDRFVQRIGQHGRHGPPYNSPASLSGSWRRTGTFPPARRWWAPSMRALLTAIAGRQSWNNCGLSSGTRVGSRRIRGRRRGDFSQPPVFARQSRPNETENKRNTFRRFFRSGFWVGFSIHGFPSLGFLVLGTACGGFALYYILINNRAHGIAFRKPEIGRPYWLWSLDWAFSGIGEKIRRREWWTRIYL